LREYTYVQIYNFCKNINLSELYDEGAEIRAAKWKMNRTYFISGQDQESRLLRYNYNFYIDLFLNDEENTIFPFENFREVSHYIRSNRSAKDMKFLIFYIISKELGAENVEIYRSRFCEEFELVW
jgi:hypothetical protein